MYYRRSCCTCYRCWLASVIIIIILILFLLIATFLMIFYQKYLYLVLPISDDSLIVTQSNDTCIVLNPFSNPKHIECTFPHTPVTNISLLEIKPGDYSLSSNLCSQFPDTTIFDASESYIKNLDNDALHSCPNLTEINLDGNSISHLEPNFFSRNFYIEKIDLSRNKLESVLTTAFLNGISEDQKSNLTDSLRILDLSENELRIFSAITVTHLRNLEVLRLHGNYPLKGFDVRFVLAHLHNLKELTLCPKHELRLNLEEKYRMMRMFNHLENLKSRKIITDKSGCKNVFGY